MCYYLSMNDELKSLTQVCKELQVSKPWVKKVEQDFGLEQYGLDKQWGSGTKGKPSAYNYWQYKFLENVTAFRASGYSLKDIQEWLDIEKKLYDLIQIHFSIEKNTNRSRVGFPTVYLIKYLLRGLEIEVDLDKVKQYEIEGREEVKELGCYRDNIDEFYRNFVIKLNDQIEKLRRIKENFNWKHA